MTIILFTFGAMACFGCGLNVVATRNADWKIELVWVFGGLIGAAMMAFAVMLRVGVIA